MVYLKRILVVLVFILWIVLLIPALALSAVILPFYYAAYVIFGVFGYIVTGRWIAWPEYSELVFDALGWMYDHTLGALLKDSYEGD